MTPASVTAGALVLCHKDAPNRLILCAGAGGYASTRLFETDGIYVAPEDQSCDIGEKNLEELCDIGNQAELESGAQQTHKFANKALAYLQSQQ